MGKRKSFIITVRILPDGPARTITGRDAWALNELHLAGNAGCTPISNPAPRWSHYIHKLRGMGFDVETVTESHGGQFSGHHARYVLHSSISLVIKDEHDTRAAA